MRTVLLVFLAANAALAQGYPPRGGGGASGVLSTAGDVRTVTLADDFSFNSLILTQRNPAAASLVLLGGRIYGDSATVSSGAWFQYNYDAGGWIFGHPINNCAGCPLWTDALRSRQTDRPVAIDEPKGLKITCKASLDTCGSGTISEGTQQALCATASSRTRICTCTASSNSSPTYAWALAGGAGSVGTSTTCPEVTP